MQLASVSDQSHVAEARRTAAAVGATVGLNETELGRVAIIVTEMATNQLKHAGGGRISLTAFDDGEGSGLEIVGFDKGRGIDDVERSMRDGHSTAGSAGQGLGAMRRQASLFEICSWPDMGTIVACRVKRSSGRAPSHKHSWSAIRVPMEGEVACGDDWVVAATPDRLCGMVVDGLGHGPMAASAAKTAIELLDHHKSLPLASLLAHVHTGMQSTRGAAAALFRVEGMKLQYAGIGNIAGTGLREDGVSRMVSVNGTLGMHAPRIKVFEYPAHIGMLVILHSDGIGTSWNLDKYPGLRAAHPSLIAAAIFRDFCRNRDDATVLVARVGAP
jgi:anti-sigma regulatory factor (Ser/Thr protein kinase)